MRMRQNRCTISVNVEAADVQTTRKQKTISGQYLAVSCVVFSCKVGGWYRPYHPSPNIVIHGFQKLQQVPDLSARSNTLPELGQRPTYLHSSNQSSQLPNTHLCNSTLEEANVYTAPKQEGSNSMQHRYPRSTIIRTTNQHLPPDD